MKMNCYLSALALTCALLLAGCQKDGGYYAPGDLNTRFTGSVYDYLASKPGEYDSLLRIVDRLGLKSTLEDSSVTLFAVSNTGFQLALTNYNNILNLSNRDPQYLRSVEYEHLDTMASFYLIRGQYPSDSLRQQDGLGLSSIRYAHPMHAKLLRANASGFVEGGPELIEFSNTKRSQFERNWVRTSTSSINIQTDNGIVHVLNADHIFGFDEFSARLLFNPPPPSLFALVPGQQTVSRESGGGASGLEGSNNILDGNSETKWLLGGFNGVDIQYQFDEPVLAGAYTITSANDFPDRDPVDWEFAGSVDGQSWETLDVRNGQLFEERFQQKVFFFTNNTPYAYYRLRIIRTGGDAMQFADWTINQAR